MYRILYRLAALTLSGFIAGLALQSSASELENVDLLFSWEGYRIARYRSPTPEQADGGVRLDTQRLLSMQRQPGRLALIDVQPVRWQDGIFLQSKPRHNLPGSLWLPNVGQGELPPEWAEYFRRGLQQASAGNPDHPLVFYCTADCWMSWNAARRAAQWGYRQVYWYAEGTDGWHEANLRLEKATPSPLPADNNATQPQ